MKVLLNILPKRSPIESGQCNGKQNGIQKFKGDDSTREVTGYTCYKNRMQSLANSSPSGHVQLQKVYECLLVGLGKLSSLLLSYSRDQDFVLQSYLK